MSPLSNETDRVGDRSKMVQDGATDPLRLEIQSWQRDSARGQGVNNDLPAANKVLLETGVLPALSIVDSPKNPGAEIIGRNTIGNNVINTAGHNEIITPPAGGPAEPPEHCHEHGRENRGPAPAADGNFQFNLLHPDSHARAIDAR